MTRQRRIVVEELRKVKSHPTADMIYEMVRKRLPNISLGTVYRNLELLSEQGIIQKITSGGTQRRFDGNPVKHSHIRCVSCGRVDDLQFETPDVLTQVNLDNGYELLGQNVEFYGKCPECRSDSNT